MAGANKGLHISGQLFKAEAAFSNGGRHRGRHGVANGFANELAKTR
jgi:hypothetical protein